MKFGLTCKCGGEMSEFTRGEEDEMSCQIQCEKCDAIYAVTVSRMN
jgi:hypothetical protein